MKNAIKKLAAIAMAFTLIGTGTTAISPNSHNTFIAHAAQEHNCQSYKKTVYSSWKEIYTKYNYTRNPFERVSKTTISVQTVEYKCAICGTHLGSDSIPKEETVYC